MTITLTKKQLAGIICLIPILITLIFLCGYRVAQEKEVTHLAEMYAKANSTPITEIEARAISSGKAVSYDQTQIEAEYVAKVLYGTCNNFSDDARRAVVWCIINRVEDPRYPDTIEEVCTQPQQWMGYSDSNPVIKELYKVSYDVLTEWRDGTYRPFDPNFTFLTWTKDEIILRTTFNETPNTKYWKVN